MKVQALSELVTKEYALEALRAYKAHRNAYDKRDWEVERIYRAISKGKTVISINDVIPKGGLDERGRPRLAIMRSDQEFCICERYLSDEIVLRAGNGRSRASDLYFKIPWPNRAELGNERFESARARTPRIPPQHRPETKELSKYHLLWEADWHDLPRDPYLLRRIGKDAWAVCAAWDLTDVELSVMRAHEVRH